MCQANPDLHLTCIDPWDNYHFRYPQEKQDKIYRQAVRRLSPFNVTILRKSSMEGLAHFEDESIDFVFIDGNHKFDWVMMDIIEWSKKVKEHGIIAVHDYYHFGWSGVVHAVNAYTQCHHIDPWYVTKEREPTAIWVKKNDP
jgi:predicted O-methyltransferase YrrM